MFVFTYTAAILAIINIGFAAFLIVQLLMGRQKNPLVKHLIALFISSFIWLIGNACADVSKYPNELIFWAGVGLIGGVFTMSSYLSLIEEFVHNQISKIKMAIFYLPPIIVSLFAFSKYSTTGTAFPFDQPAVSTAGSLYWIVMLYVLFTWIYSFVEVGKMRKKATVQQRAQISYIFFGFAFQFAGAMVCCLILPLMGNNNYFTLGAQFIIFLNAALAYATLKHQLLNLKFVIQKSLIYSIIIGATIGIYLLAINAAIIFLEISHSISYPMASLLAAVFGAAGIPPLSKYLQKKTDKIFFKDHVSYGEAVYSLSLAVNLHIDLDSLLDGTSKELYRIYKPTWIKIYLVRERMLYERDGGEKKSKIRENTSFDLMPKTDDATLFVNAEHDGAILAQVLIGEKKSGDIYLPEDREILNTFSFQLALALEKTYLYEKLKNQKEKEAV